MAKTVDDLQVRISVDGTQQLSAANAQLTSVDQNVKQINNTVRSFNTRILSANIQDIAVQAELGVSGLRILGQQGSEVLAAFGARGAALGAALAVGVAVAKPVLNALGVEMRSLTELTRDATKATDDFKAAQKENLPTTASMVFQYGEAAAGAKKFFEVQEQLKKQVALSEQKKSLEELADTFKKFSTEAANQPRMRGPISSIFELGRDAYGLFQRMNLGLTADQARRIGDELQGINKKTPDQAIASITKLAEEIKNSSEYSEKAKKAMAEMLLPLAENALKAQQDIRAAAKEASAFNAELLRLQTTSILPVGDARRNFDQIKAIELEGRAKIAEFTLQADQKFRQDQVDRTREIAAFRIKTETEILDKVKEFRHQQEEAFRSQSLNNGNLNAQIELEAKIIKLRDQGLFSLEATVAYDEQLLKNAKQYEDQLIAINERKRKGEITDHDARDLLVEIAILRERADDNARATMNAAVRKKIIMDEMEISKKAVEDQIARFEKLGEIQRGINDRKIELQFEAGQIGQGALEKQIDKIKNDAKKAALEAGRAFAATFGGEDGMTAEKAQELADGLEKIAQGYRDISEQQIENLKNSKTWSAGWSEAFKTYKENANDAAQQAKGYFDTFTRSFEDVFVNMAKSGEWTFANLKKGFRDLANNMIADFIRIQAQKAATGFLSGFSFSGLFGGSKGGTGLEGMSPETLALAGLAGGGPTDANKPYIVGEQGPELFVPKTAGNIVPNNQLGGSAQMSQPVTVNYNIQAVDASSFRSLVARDPSFIYSVTEMGRRSQPTRRAA